MNLMSMYDLIKKENIDLMNFNLANAKARIIQFPDDTYTIVLNESKIENSLEKKEILAEELGHYYCNALYPIFSSTEVIRKAELRAQKWAYSVLVPLEKLLIKIKENLSLYELADYFEVEPEYMKNCIDFYESKYGILERRM